MSLIFNRLGFPKTGNQAKPSRAKPRFTRLGFFLSLGAAIKIFVAAAPLQKECCPVSQDYGCGAAKPVLCIKNYRLIRKCFASVSLPQINSHVEQSWNPKWWFGLESWTVIPALTVPPNHASAWARNISHTYSRYACMVTTDKSDTTTNDLAWQLICFGFWSGSVAHVMDIIVGWTSHCCVQQGSAQALRFVSLVECNRWPILDDAIARMDTIFKLYGALFANP